MSTNATMINLDGTTPFKILQGASFTIPDTVQLQSPTGGTVGISPTNTFNSMRPVMGGQIIAALNDQAVQTSPDFSYKLNVGDVIAVSAVASSAANVSVNGVVVYTITNVTTVALVFGFYG